MENDYCTNEYLHVRYSTWFSCYSSNNSLRFYIIKCHSGNRYTCVCIECMELHFLVPLANNKPGNCGK